MFSGGDAEIDVMQDNAVAKCYVDVTHVEEVVRALRVVC